MEELKENQTESQDTQATLEEDIMAQWEEALREAGATGETVEEGTVSEITQESPSETSPEPETPGMVESPKLEEFKEAAPKEGPYPDLEFILDIPLEVSVEIGRTKMIINDLLKLSQGSIIELNKMAGEPVEIFVNGKLMARGEVVVVNERFGVRLTEIISPQERIKKLGE